MRLLRCGAQVAENDVAIRQAVADMLRRCDIVEPPTPLEEILRFRRLSVEERKSLLPHEIIPTSLRRSLHRIGSRVRGLLDLRSRHMVVDESLHPRRRVFVKYHEIGHDVLDWHRELFVVTSEFDLRPDVRRTFEAEANRFSALTIFQGDDFEKWQRGRRLRMNGLAALAERYDASLTSTAMQYVSVQDLPVALLLGLTESAEGQRGIRFRSGLANSAYLDQFPRHLLGDGLPPTAATCAILNIPGVEVSSEEFEVLDRNGERRNLIAETIFNGYETLSLFHVQPKRARMFGLIPAVARKALRGTRK